MHGGAPRTRRKYQTGQEADIPTIEVNPNEIINIAATAAITTAMTVVVQNAIK